MKKSVLLLIHIAFLTLTYGQTKDQINHLDSYYEKALKEWNIPGMAIAIVSDNEILFEKGYGYANIENKLKVDEHTLFAVASNSKAFTASAIAKLVDAGQLKWDDKVIDYIPYFKLYDAYVTAHFTIEDLLSHRSGLKTFSGDLLWYGSDLSPKEIIESAQYLEPAYEYRTTFGYSNIMYLVAGQIIEKITGQSWQSYIQKEFISPLGMDRTILTTNDIAKMTNVATPYYEEHNTNHELEWTNWDNIAPAGAIISSVHDYSNWLMLNINEGTLNKKEYFSNAQFTNMTTPHVNFKVGQSSRKNAPSKHFKAYGMGWSLEDNHGAKIISHSGGYDGMISKSCVVPERNIGIVILTNNLNWLPSAILNKTLDVILDNNLTGKDWSAEYLSYKKTSDLNDQKTQKEDIIKKGTLGDKSYDLKAYTGTYNDQMYGDIIIKIDNNQLYLDMTRTAIFKAPLSHWNKDIFTFRFDTKTSSLPMGKLWFDMDKNGELIGLHIDVPNPDFDFGEFNFIKNKEE